MSHLENVGIGEALDLVVGLAVVVAFEVVRDVAPELVVEVAVLFAVDVLGEVGD
jgi:hypothetical protein